MSNIHHQTSDFSVHTVGNVELIVDCRAVSDEGIQSLLDLPGVLRNLPGRDSRSRGRESVWTWSPNWSESDLVVRQYVHGGVLGRLWGSLFLSSRQMHRELRIARHALDCGVPTCRPVALRIEHVFGPLVRGHYVTEKLESTQNLLEFCRMHGEELTIKQRIEVSHAIARTLSRMHDAGIYHSDLNLKNILVRRENAQNCVQVIDFKKSGLRNRLDLAEGLQNLVRLDRSVLKWPASRAAISLTDRLRTLRRYIRIRGAGQSDWKDTARKVLTHHRFHALSRR